MFRYNEMMEIPYQLKTQIADRHSLHRVNNYYGLKNIQILLQE
jgi:hypothetical protein